MKNIHLIVFYATLTIIIVPGNHSDLLAQETLTWAYMAKAEPECWEENSVARGIQPEIVNYLCDRLGIKVIHRFYPWARAQSLVKHGNADAMLTTPTAARFKYCVFGKGQAKPSYWNIFYLKSKTDIAEKIQSFSALEDLKPYSLLDFLGNGWTAAFMKEGYNIHYVAEIETIPEILAKGRHDLCINSTTMINYWAQKKNVKTEITMHAIDWPWTRFHYVFMVSRKSVWKDKGLIRALDAELVKMKENGEWNRILKKYQNPYGFGEPFKSTLDEKYLEKEGFYKDYNNYPVYKKQNR